MRESLVANERVLYTLAEIDERSVTSKAVSSEVDMPPVFAQDPAVSDN